MTTKQYNLIKFYYLMDNKELAKFY